MLPIIKGQQKTDDSLLIADTMELVSDIEKTVENIMRMCQLEYMSSIRDEIIAMQTHHEQAVLIFESWQKFQRDWTMVVSIVSTDESKQSLAEQISKFGWVRRRSDLSYFIHFLIYTRTFTSSAVQSVAQVIVQSSRHTRHQQRRLLAGLCGGVSKWLPHNSGHD